MTRRPEHEGWDSPAGTRELALLVAQARADGMDVYTPRHAAPGTAAPSHHRPQHDGSRAVVPADWRLAPRPGALR